MICRRKILVIRITGLEEGFSTVIIIVIYIYYYYYYYYLGKAEDKTVNISP
jgi:hypothetical protein